jgi:hypothetical protein
MACGTIERAMFITEYITTPAGINKNISVSIGGKTIIICLDI